MFARQRWRAWIETFAYDDDDKAQVVRPSAMAGVD